MKRNSRYDVHLSLAEREALEHFVSKGGKKTREITRARILLLSDAGKKDREIMDILHLSGTTIRKMCRKYVQTPYDHILDILKEAPRSGRPMKYDVHLSLAEREALEHFVSKGGKKTREITRARILLLSDAGKKDREIMDILHLPGTTIWRMRRKYVQTPYDHILDILKEAPCSGRTMKYDVHLSLAEREALEHFVSKGGKIDRQWKAREITRARILLLSNAGKKDREIMDILHLPGTTIWRMRRKYVQTPYDHILDILKKAPRSGGRIKIDQRIEANITMIACSDPPEGSAR